MTLTKMLHRLVSKESLHGRAGSNAFLFSAAVLLHSYKCTAGEGGKSHGAAASNST